jgi:hypothetical protein
MVGEKQANNCIMLCEHLFILVVVVLIKVGRLCIGRHSSISVAQNTNAMLNAKKTIARSF